jgi:hypothetical protein
VRREFVGALIGTLNTLFLTVSSAQAHRAQPHFTNWIIPGDDKLAQVVSIRNGGYFKLSRMVPSKMYTLLQDAFVPRRNILAIPKDTLMVPLADDPHSVCELRAHAGSAFACLTDTDGDGKFDTYFGTQVFNEIFLGSIGDDSGFEKLSQPVELRKVDPKITTPEISLEMNYYGITDGFAQYTVCTKISWKSRYFHERYCNKKTIKSKINDDMNISVFGQTISMVDAESGSQKLTIEYNKYDFEFSTRFSFPW